MSSAAATFSSSAWLKRELACEGNAHTARWTLGLVPAWQSRLVILRALDGRAPLTHVPCFRPQPSFSSASHKFGSGCNTL